MHGWFFHFRSTDIQRLCRKFQWICNAVEQYRDHYKLSMERCACSEMDWSCWEVYWRAWVFFRLRLKNLISNVFNIFQEWLDQRVQSNMREYAELSGAQRNFFKWLWLGWRFHASYCRIWFEAISYISPPTWRQIHFLCPSLSGNVFFCTIQYDFYSINYA